MAGEAWRPIELGRARPSAGSDSSKPATIRTIVGAMVLEAMSIRQFIDREERIGDRCFPAENSGMMSSSTGEEGLGGHETAAQSNDFPLMQAGGGLPPRSGTAYLCHANAEAARITTRSPSSHPGGGLKPKAIIPTAIVPRFIEPKNNMIASRLLIYDSFFVMATFRDSRGAALRLHLGDRADQHSAALTTEDKHRNVPNLPQNCKKLDQDDRHYGSEHHVQRRRHLKHDE